MKNLVLGFLIASSSTFAYAISDEDIMQIYASMVNQWKAQISESFDLAEKEVYNIDVPEPPSGPDEDPAKCICKGTGIIVQGDGHESACPFHSKQEPEEVEEPVVEETAEEVELPPLVKIKKSTCQCETKCACDDCQCQKTETELLLRKTEIE